MLDQCPMMEDLGYKIKNGTYIFCSSMCENNAKKEFDWSPPQQADRGPCPPALAVSHFFGGQVDETWGLGGLYRKRDETVVRVTYQF